MKNLILSICIFVVCCCCTSCGVSHQASANVNLAQTEVVLSKNNFRVVGTASGKSTQTYIFCIGGRSKKSLENSAVNDMYLNADLLGTSRAVINTNVVYKANTILGIYTQATCIASGTIIEFIDE